MKTSRPDNPWLRDLAWAVLIFGLVVAGLIATDFVEWLFHTTRRYEFLELDEWIAAVPSLTLAVAWFAFRRWQEAENLSKNLAEAVEMLSCSTESLVAAKGTAERAEAALKDNEQALSQAQRVAKVAHWRWSFGTRRLTSWSDEFSEIYGITHDAVDAEDEGQFRCVHPDDRADLAAVYDAATPANPGFDVQYRIVRGDGEIRYIREVAEPEYDPAGQVIAHFGIIQDVTEQRNAEAALRETEQRLMAFIDNAPAAISLKDPQGRYFMINKHFERLSDLRNDQIVGKTPSEIFPADFAQAGVTHDGEILRAKKPSTRESKFDTTDGLRVFLTNKFPIFDSRGEVSAIGTIHTDITQRKQAQEQLTAHRDHLQDLVEAATADIKSKAAELEAALSYEKELVEVQRQFVATASHEFRTPLAVIDSSVQRLLRRKDRISPDELETRAKKIRKAVTTMTDLMEGTLATARLDAGTISIEIKEQDLRSVVGDACVRQRELNDDHKIDCDLESLPDMIKGDRAALEQVFANLLSNAIKYSPDQPEITVKGWREGEDALVSISDHGVGIDEDDLASLFKRYFRAKTSIGISGTGIGLNLSKVLVELHGGSIMVESKKGGGSTFIVRLPLAGPSQSNTGETIAA